MPRKFDDLTTYKLNFSAYNDQQNTLNNSLKRNEFKE